MLDDTSDIDHSDYCDGQIDEDTGECQLCEAWHAEAAAYWRPLYEGEKRAGLLATDEEIRALRSRRRWLSLADAREMGGYDPGENTWSDTPARFTRD